MLATKRNNSLLTHISTGHAQLDRQFSAEGCLIVNSYITQQVNSLVQQRGQGQNFEAEAKVSRGRGRGQVYEAETEAEAKILVSRPVWPRGFSL